MRLAIMQPYFLPYIGYFQLMAGVDKFVMLDDVNYINKGWINRNRLLLNGQAFTFTVPLTGASQNRLINDIRLAPDPVWRKKLIRTVQLAYRRAPHFDSTMTLLEKILGHPADQLSAFVFQSLTETARFLGIATTLVESSNCYDNSELHGEDRILDICKQEKAKEYVNPIGGISLYSRETFSRDSVVLRYMKSRPISYAQNGADHVAWLSILDVMMFNSPCEIHRLLREFDFV